VDERARQDFADFVAGRSAELFRLAYVLTADRHAAEDLLQSALAKAAARWGRIDSTPEGYVWQIMYREQVSWWRRRARRPVTVVASARTASAGRPLPMRPSSRPSPCPAC
jgi:DNA-directed RNA polymerase specialized sigma24 family protein